MITAEKVIQKYFPHEHIRQLISLELVKEKSSLFNLPLGYFHFIKQVIYPHVSLIETESYWFYDGRYRLTIAQLVIHSFSLVFVYFFFRQLNVEISSGLVYLGLLFLFLYGFFEYYLLLVKGMVINVYEKDWVTITKTENQINMKVNMPKYSRDSIFRYRLKSKILDFLGLTVSSAPLEIVYQFKVLNKRETLSHPVGQI